MAENFKDADDVSTVNIEYATLEYNLTTRKAGLWNVLGGIRSAKTKKFMSELVAKVKAHKLDYIWFLVNITKNTRSRPIINLDACKSKSNETGSLDSQYSNRTNAILVDVKKKQIELFDPYNTHQTNVYNMMYKDLHKFLFDLDMSFNVSNHYPQKSIARKVYFNDKDKELCGIIWCYIYLENKTRSLVEHNQRLFINKMQNTQENKYMTEREYHAQVHKYISKLPLWDVF